MRIWLIGAEQRGSEVLRQLAKNANIEVVISAPTDRPKAVVDGLIAKVDHVEVVTSVNINSLARRIRPDLIIIDPSADPHNFGRLTGGTTFADALNQEMVAVSDYPCVVLS